MPHHARTGSGPLKPLKTPCLLPSGIPLQVPGACSAVQKSGMLKTASPLHPLGTGKALAGVVPPGTSPTPTAGTPLPTEIRNYPQAATGLPPSHQPTSARAGLQHLLKLEQAPTPAINQMGFHRGDVQTVLKGGIFLLPSSPPSPGLGGETRCWKAFRKGRLLRRHMRAIWICTRPLFPPAAPGTGSVPAHDTCTGAITSAGFSGPPHQWS